MKGKKKKKKDEVHYSQSYWNKIVMLKRVTMAPGWRILLFPEGHKYQERHLYITATKHS